MFLELWEVLEASYFLISKKNDLIIIYYNNNKMELKTGNTFKNFTLKQYMGNFGKTTIWNALLNGTNIIFEIAILNENIIKTSVKTKIYSNFNGEDIVIKKELGSGTYGFVYEIENKNNEKYALKIFNEPFEGEDEYTIYKNLSGCPNIVPIYDGFFINENDQFFLKMGLMKCEIYKMNLPLNIIFSIVKNILIALNFMHQKNIIHGDLKLSNILLDDKDNAYLCDFSNSFFKDTCVQEVGTIWYRAPEYCIPNVSNYMIDTPSDIWSLGICFLSMLSEGDVPKFFRLNTPSLLYGRISSQPLIDNEIDKIVDKLDIIECEYVKNICKKMLTVEPEYRITADEALNNYFET